MTSQYDQNAHWWRFIHWIFEMCSIGQRVWEHPKTEEDTLELKKYFEMTYPDWKPTTKHPLANA